LLLSVAIGMATAGLARMVPSWTSPGRKLVGSPVPSLAVGALVGGLTGALLAALMLGLGEPPELPEDPTVVPGMASILWGLVFWVGAGWLIGALVQTLGVPDGVEPIDLDQVRTVRTRLVTAFGLPLLAVLTILVLVLSFAFVFLSFPSWSPLTGTVIAGSILAFAALSASKPNMKVGLQELVVAAAGIGVVVVLIYAALQTTGAGHSEEEGVDESFNTEESNTGDTTDTTTADTAGEALVVHLF
jgi:MFS family permease